MFILPEERGECIDFGPESTRGIFVDYDPNATSGGCATFSGYRMVEIVGLKKVLTSHLPAHHDGAFRLTWQRRSGNCVQGSLMSTLNASVRVPLRSDEWSCAFLRYATSFVGTAFS